MTQNADGTATCDSCGVQLSGYGVLYGLITSDLLGDYIRELIICYACRTTILMGLVNHHEADVCADCGIATTRAVAFGMLATDLDPDESGNARQMIFCYANGSAAMLLARIHIGE